MAQSTTKVYEYKLHHYDANKDFVKTIGTFHLYLPKQTAGFTAGKFVEYGYPNTSGTNILYTDMTTKCPDFRMMCQPVIKNINTTRNSNNYSAYFNNFQVLQDPTSLQISNGDFLVAENTKNGVCVVQKHGYTGTTAQYYTLSLSDFEDGVSAGGLTVFPAALIYCNANGAGDSLGGAYGFSYYETDENDYPVSFYIVSYRGVFSSTNTIYVSECPAYSRASALGPGLGAFFSQGDPYYRPPYSEVPESDEGGGDGSGEEDSEANPLDPIPTKSFVDAGFCRIYNPTLGQLQSLSQYMWTDTTFLQTVINHLKQLLENPMDAIISLSIVPCSIPTGASEEVKVMYVPTGVYMYPAISQFIDVDCGSVTINKNIGCALDYNPYTKIHVYLPYIGQVTLNTDEVMGKTLHLIYRIDIVTGICAAHILVNGNVMYVFSGHCSVSQPLASADFSAYLNAMITAAKSVAAVAAGAGGAPSVAAGLIGGPAPRTSRSQESGSESRTSRNPNTGRQITLGTESYSYDVMRTSLGASFGELASRAATNTVSSVMNSKLIVEHTNGFGGNSGYVSQRTPFIIIERARLCNPKEYGNYNGYPSMIYLNLGELSGYTEVQQIQLTGINATNPELSEMAELLKSGVIL